MYEIRPVTFRTAREFVTEHHRHNAAPQGHKFSIGLMADGELIGVVIVGRPVSRILDDGCTAEITRCCVLGNQRNANSKLYAAALRTARGMGYRRVVTDTLPEESGSSLRAVGFTLDGRTAYHSWDMPGRPRKMPDKYPQGQKNRWIKTFKE
jgi:hypothetical protein